ncbi:DUF4129 domain-containing protein [Sphingomonas lenta]|uniref:DUF4129 domain-containing protein n=1 Tax=Sphingomonas lenta TaxID=1141887 RepID=A0A2A2SCQ6_9SPHN|nr:DUF4129 domain-containing protein [Sphingomonas lenta]PAX07047.1 DUF4129 domain-containing protein [Sphingomonas lenta]
MAAEGAAGVQRLEAAHRALRADGDVQFALRTQDPPAEPPAWLKRFFEWLGELLAPVGRFLRWLGSFMPDAPVARILLWSVLALFAAALVWAVVERVRHGEWRLPRRRSRTVEGTPEEEWAPEAAQTRGWLQEADALAAAGRYAEAAHHLLLRSVEDMARRRPQLVRPALTSRELAAAPAVPPTARTLFADIARLVERSLFGGRAVDQDDWRAARAAYADYALPGAWRA